METHMKHGYVLIDKNVAKSSKEANSVSPLGKIVQYLLVNCSQWLYRT